MTKKPPQSLSIQALSNLEKHVEHLWTQIHTILPVMESLSEDQRLPLAALVVSKVYFYSGELDKSFSYALRAGPLFDVSEDSDYSRTLSAKAADDVASIKAKSFDGATVVDPRLEAIVERLLQKYVADGMYKQAILIAIECRRTDIIEESLMADENIKKTIRCTNELVDAFEGQPEYRNELAHFGDKISMRFSSYITELYKGKSIQEVIFKNYKSEDVERIMDKLKVHNPFQNDRNKSSQVKK